MSVFGSTASTIAAGVGLTALTLAAVLPLLELRYQLRLRRLPRSTGGDRA
ncbi:hypothetical protein [Halobellus ordinarius]|nr:hypothetical protein [Halobellus sp. ZY16]